MSFSKWLHFIQQCFRRRTSAHDFRELAEYLNESHPIAGRKLIQIVIECRLSFTIPSDPLIWIYIRCIVSSDLGQISDVLLVLIHAWNDRGPKNGLAKEISDPGSLSSPDTILINDLSTSVTSQKNQLTELEIRRSLSLTSKWLVALIGWISEDGGNRSYIEILTLLEALGILFASLISTEQGIAILANSDNQEFKFLVVDALETALPFLSNISLQLHSRLEMIQKHLFLYRISESKEAEQLAEESQTMPDALQFDANIVEGPGVNARAGIYVYFNAMLCGVPISDDTLLFNYLNIRYAGHHNSMFIEAIIASFDVLSNGQAMSEGQPAIKLYRSFLTNRLPPLLSLICASSIEPLSVELSISQALDRIDQVVFPRSAYDMGLSSPLVAVRQEFLFACALNHLIPEAIVENLLGENPMQTLPSHGLYDKNQLVKRLVDNQQKSAGLIGEMELMDGNAGAVAIAVIEVMHLHSRNKDTQPLKELCNTVLRRPQVIDVLVLFRSPSYILGPLCSLLDSWNWDEIHGESQPVYEEFGAILLFVLFLVHHLQLSASEIGITSLTSFTRQLLEQDASDENFSQLNESRKKHLGEWITALFVADSLSDELTATCSPQEFYLLLPTLLDQSLEACSSGRLSVEALVSGFDYLREPFLLASVLIGLKWLRRQIWQVGNASQSALSLFRSLMKSPSSTETRELHQNIMSLVADAPWSQQRTVTTELSSQKQLAASIAEALKSQVLPKRNVSWAAEDFLSGNALTRGLLPSVSQKFQQLLGWSTSRDMGISPPKFTFKLISASLGLYGASRVLSHLMDELKSNIGTSNFDPALDLVTSLVCAPTSSNGTSPRALSLLDAVKIAHTDLAKILKRGDTLYAEALVHLHRKVALFSVLPSHQHDNSMLPNASLGPDLSNIDLQNMDLDTGSANPELELDVGHLNVEGASTSELSKILEGSGALDSFGANADPSVTDDVFGLGDGNIQMMNYDDMDFEGMF